MGRPGKRQAKSKSTQAEKKAKGETDEKVSNTSKKQSNVSKVKQVEEAKAPPTLKKNLNDDLAKAQKSPQKKTREFPTKKAYTPKKVSPPKKWSAENQPKKKSPVKLKTPPKPTQPDPTPEQTAEDLSSSDEESIRVPEENVEEVTPVKKRRKMMDKKYRNLMVVKKYLMKLHASNLNNCQS